MTTDAPCPYCGFPWTLEHLCLQMERPRFGEVTM